MVRETVAMETRARVATSRMSILFAAFAAVFAAAFAANGRSASDAALGAGLERLAGPFLFRDVPVLDELLDERFIFCDGASTWNRPGMGLG